MKLAGISNQVYIVAVNEANLQSHEFITPEHFLYAALMFDVGKEIIEQSGGNAKNIEAELQNYFEEFIPTAVDEAPSESFSFVRMFETASAQAANSEKSEITIGDIFIAMFSLPESFAVYIMEKNGIDRLQMLKYISHGMEREPNESERITKAEESEKPTEKSALKKYAVNLTEKARRNQLDPLIGREDIIDRTILVLCRRLKNNPVHVGDAGVGKTAIVEGLAQKIASDDVPRALRNANIYFIDMGNIIAGTKYRGDFEDRLIKILDDAAAEKNAIIYIDEIHNVVGAGAISGSAMDATSILKPYLTKGGLRFIGSTTFEEYKKHFEKDSALTRRFQKIDIIEPSVEEAVKILNGIKHKYEEYHNVSYGDEIIRTVCELTGKYLNDRKLPDKAIDVIDETGAFVGIRAAQDKRDKIEVTRTDIEKTISLMAKIPENSISDDESEILRNLENNLRAKIYGQDDVVTAVVSAIKASRSGLNNPDKPVASLLFVGPTGVGKTEIAKQLAENLNIKLQRFDMSEYQESHSVARLIGSPPGYVGYDEGGLLTDAIRKTPYSVLLLDEIEKAHPDILNILLQVMDYGSLTDNAGKKADFRNIILIMTSNAGAKEIGRKVIGFDEAKLNFGAIDREVERVFSPEFRNRLDDIITFNYVDEAMAEKIVLKAVAALGERLSGKQIKLDVSSEALAWIAKKGLSKTYGAREIIRIVEKDIKKLLVDKVLFGDLNNGGNIQISIKDDKIVIL